VGDGAERHPAVPVLTRACPCQVGIGITSRATMGEAAASAASTAPKVAATWQEEER
jgi:hypothetical protein